MSDTGLILEAETADVRAFARLLRGIGLKHQAAMTISKAGFEVTVEDSKSLAATAWIPTNIFSSFNFSHDGTEVFEVSLDGLLQCLNIFGGAGAAGGGKLPLLGGKKRRWAGDGERGEDDDDEWTADKRKERRTGMRLSWAGEGEPLKVLLRDDAKGPVTTCELNTYEPEELMNQAFDDSRRSVYLIMKSEWFRDALLDLPPSCSRVTLRAVPKEGDGRRRGASGSFSIYAEGDFGTVQFDYPNEKEVMDAFECDEAVTFSYHAQHVILLARSLVHSLKICLQIEDTGFLCVQVMMPIPESMPTEMHNGILEFKMHALEDQEDE